MSRPKTGKKPGGRLLLAMAFLAVFGTCDRPKRPIPLSIAVAASARPAADSLAAAFSQKTGRACTVVSSSSGKLSAQIRAGAPYRIFLSANRHYPEALHAAGLASKPPRVYAYGQVLLWTGQIFPDTSLAFLAGPDIAHIALAQPAHAPYGMAAMAILRRYGILERVRGKLVHAENVGGVNHLIASGSVAAGFSAKSSWNGKHRPAEGHLREFPPPSGPPIPQAALLLDKNAPPEELRIAEEFFQFLFSEKGRHILKSYGYAPGP